MITLTHCISYWLIVTISLGWFSYIDAIIYSYFHWYFTHYITIDHCHFLSLAFHYAIFFFFFSSLRFTLFSSFYFHFLIFAIITLLFHAACHYWDAIIFRYAHFFSPFATRHEHDARYAVTLNRDVATIWWARGVARVSRERGGSNVYAVVRSTKRWNALRVDGAWEAAAGEPRRALLPRAARAAGVIRAPAVKR